MFWNEKAFSSLPSPCYVIDRSILEHNMKTMSRHCASLNIKPLLSIKGFPLIQVFQDMAPFLSGISAASLFEAQLGKHMGKECHIHAPVYLPQEMTRVLELCDHIVFNSLSQWNTYGELIKSLKGKVSPALRINPEYSEIIVEKYNPCLPCSRFGVTYSQLKYSEFTGLEGFHIHALCDQEAETFSRVINVVIDKFKDYLPGLKWINLGGGQQLADDDFNVKALSASINRLINDFGLEVYVEPCESLVTSSGYLVATVLDIIRNDKETAILDASAICHMPDVLEMPYCPDIAFPVSGKDGRYDYLLAGLSCMAGDIIGEYKFAQPLNVGDKIIFSDMGAYTFAKESYFNGINHAAIILYDKECGFDIVKQYDYYDYERQYL